MIFGYLRSDGRIFDREGAYLGDKQEIENEDFVIHEIDVWVMYGWKWHSGKSGMDPGFGTLVVGDGMVQYSQKINVKAKLRGGPALPVSLIDYRHAKGLDKRGYMDFLQFDIDEVSIVKFKLFGNVVYLEDEYEDKLQIGFPKEPRVLVDFLKELS